MLWLGLNASSPVLLQLLARINAAVEEALPEITAASTEFTAHVSLFKKADDLPAYKAFESLLWQVKDFVLVESSSQQSEVKYQVLHRWPLC
jgi:2'-5' RNA ligase